MNLLIWLPESLLLKPCLTLLGTLVVVYNIKLMDNGEPELDVSLK